MWSDGGRIRHIRGPMRSPAWGTLAGVSVPAGVAVLLWVFVAPRSELMSVGGGRGVRLTDAGADGGSQFLMLVILLGFAVVCSTVVLWRRHPGLRRPAGVPALVVVPGLACAVAAAVAAPVATLLASPPGEVPRGQVVAQAPTAGALFFGRMIYGTSGPAWEQLPPGAGWLVLGMAVAAFTVAALVHFSPTSDLRELSAEADDSTEGTDTRESLTPGG